MIGIIGAMDIEIELLAQALEGARTERRGCVSFLRGAIEGREVAIARAGIGKVNAAVCAQTMALCYAPSLILNTGVAGALDAGLRVGDVVVGRDVIQHDVDTTALGDPPGFVSTVNALSFACDEDAARALCACAAELNLRATQGRIASGDQFVASSARKAEIVSLFSAAVCEMEAGAIAQVCALNGVRCAVIRSVSDGGDEEAAMSYAEFLPLAARNSAQLVLAFLRKANTFVNEV